MTWPATTDAPDRAPEPAIARDPGSYRDPGGFVYRRDGVLYRQIGPSSIDDWDAFLASGLADRLIASGRLVGHEVVDLADAATPDARAVIKPDPIEFISYPYEWTFGELQDAALLTLDIELEALEAGWTLKDASAYNVQFRDGRAGADRLALVRAARGRAPRGSPTASSASTSSPRSRSCRGATSASRRCCAPTPTASRSTWPRASCPWRTRLNFGLALAPPPARQRAGPPRRERRRGQGRQARARSAGRG